MWADSTKFLQWHSSVGLFQLSFFPVVFQCTLGQPVAFQWHSSVHWTSQCTLAQGKGWYKCANAWIVTFQLISRLLSMITGLTDNKPNRAWKVSDVSWCGIDFYRLSLWRVLGARSCVHLLNAKSYWLDDVIKWTHSGRGAMMFSLICAWINGWVNSREAGDLRRNRAHHDFTVMVYGVRAVINHNLAWVFMW